MTNFPVKTAIVSFGMSGQVFHGPCLRINPDYRVMYIVERSKHLSKKMFPDARIVRSFEDLLLDKELELVIINTPDSLHFEMSKAALAAGKHVVVEKPFTLIAAQADELIALSEKQNRLLTVFQNRRWDGDFLTVKQVLDSGMLGRLVEFESHFDRYRTAITPDTWKEEGDDYTGVLFNLGSHMVDQVLVLFGMPHSVTAHLQVVRTGGKVADYYDIRMHYDNFSALLKCSYLVREEGPRYILHGENGSFLKWGIDPQEDTLKKGRLPEGAGWGSDPEALWGKLNTQLHGLHFCGKLETIQGNYQAFYSNLYKAIRFKQPLAVPPRESRNVIYILEKCLESHHSGKTVQVEK